MNKLEIEEIFNNYIIMNNWLSNALYLYDNLKNTEIHGWEPKKEGIWIIAGSKNHKLFLSKKDIVIKYNKENKNKIEIDCYEKFFNLEEWTQKYKKSILRLISNKNILLDYFEIEKELTIIGYQFEKKDLEARIETKKN